MMMEGRVLATVGVWVGVMVAGEGSRVLEAAAEEAAIVDGGDEEEAATEAAMRRAAINITATQ